MQLIPEEGMYLLADGWRFGELLQTDNGYKDASYPGCQWRVPMGNGMYLVGINLTVTGKQHWVSSTGQYRSRVKIEYVGDCEESVFDKGWLYTTS